MHVHRFAEHHVTVYGGHGSLHAVISTSGCRTEAWAARPEAVSQEVMTARELRATTSLMTLMVLAGIAGFVTLRVLKNLLKARRRARPAARALQAPSPEQVQLPHARRGPYRHVSKGTASTCTQAGLTERAMRSSEGACSLLLSHGRKDQRACGSGSSRHAHCRRAVRVSGRAHREQRLLLAGRRML